MGIALAITSGKGGTGKTSLVSGVSSCLAALGYRVLCIDMDIGLRNLDISLGMTDRVFMDFTDVIEQRCSLEKAAVSHPVIHGLYLLTAPVSLPTVPIREESIGKLLKDARYQFDYIFIDCPAGLGSGFRLSTCAVDRAILVSTNDPSALRDAQRTVSEINRMMKTLHLVMNRIQPKIMRKMRTNIDDAMNTAGLPLIGVIPEDVNVMLSANQGEPLILSSRKGAAMAYFNIAKRITGQSTPLMHLY